jgi:hypothetical protein
MKMRPQFNLRFRDAEQFLDIKYLASEADIPVNEWILRQIEKVPVLLGARLTAKKETSDAEIKAGGSEGVAADIVLAENKQSVGKDNTRHSGKFSRGDATAKVIEGALTGNSKLIPPMPPFGPPENIPAQLFKLLATPKKCIPIELDAVGTTGCKVTVSRPLTGQLAHAANCTCYSCKPQKEK